MPRWLNLANLFTLSRVVMTPFIVRAIFDGQHTRALVLFFLAVNTLVDVAYAVIDPRIRYA